MRVVLKLRIPEMKVISEQKFMFYSEVQNAPK